MQLRILIYKLKQSWIQWDKTFVEKYKSKTFLLVFIKKTPHSSLPNPLSQETQNPPHPNSRVAFRTVK